MTRYYSDPSRENETYALPDVEVFYAPAVVGELIVQRVSEAANVKA